MKGDTKEKTEQPTRKRLRDARKKGSVAKSSDLVAACTFTAVALMLGLFHESFLDRLQDIFAILGKDFQLPPEQIVGYAATLTFKNVLLFIIPILAVSVLVVVVVHILQFGFIVAFDPVSPQFDKINPVEGFKRIFSVEVFLEAVKSVIKILLLGLVLFFVIKGSLGYLMYLPDWGLDAIGKAWLVMIIKISAIAALVFLLVALFDLFLQKFLFLRRHKMSKDEVIREYKDTEGNPMIKGKRRSLYHEMIAQATAKRAAKATVIITNPTHYAVALYYRRRETGLPVVITKGEFLNARKIIDIAAKANVPIIRNPPVARALYFQVQIGDCIPGDLLEPVAEIIRWVFLNYPGPGIRG